MLRERRLRVFSRRKSGRPNSESVLDGTARHSGLPLPGDHIEEGLPSSSKRQGFQEVNTSEAGNCLERKRSGASTGASGSPPSSSARQNGV